MTQPIDPSRLNALSPLDELKPASFRSLLGKTEVLKAMRGQTLFKQGDTAQQSVYVLSGKVQLHDGTDGKDVIEGGSAQARFPIAPELPRQVSAIALDNVEYISIDSELLDLTVTWDQTGIYEVGELASDVQEENNDWMSALLQIKAFQKIPPANIQSLFMRMKQVNYKRGDVVVRQGESGDYYYFIIDGKCTVLREIEGKSGRLILGELKFGDSFGEEALITDAERNATIEMVTDGSMMRLSKDDFHSLIAEPAVETVEHAEALDIVANGGKWLDVRLPNEFKEQHEDGAINLPLYMLRMKLGTLDPATTYVACCATGVRSSAAAFILQTKNYHAVVLKGGLNRNTAPELSLEASQTISLN